MWEAPFLRHLHATHFSSFVGVEAINLLNPRQQRSVGELVFLVRKFKQGIIKDSVCSQVRVFDGSVAAIVRTNTATKLKNGTNTLFIFATMIYLNHSWVLLILDGWNTLRVLHL